MPPEAILRPNGDVFDDLAHFGFAPEYRACKEARPIPTGPGSLAGRALVHAKPVQITDVLRDPDFTLPKAAKIGGQRTNGGKWLARLIFATYKRLYGREDDLLKDRVTRF